MRSNIRDGFTLPEVLVTVAIIAVLAAVVVPSVVQQVSKGDQGQLASDLKAVQSAVSTFATDTRAYPGYFKQLRTAIGPTDSSADPMVRRVYSPAEIGRWAGPYGSFSSDTLQSGYGLIFKDTITASSNELQLTVVGPGSSQGGYSKAQIMHIDSLVDGGSGPTSGMIRWTLAGTSPDSAKNIKVVVMTVR